MGQQEIKLIADTLDDQHNVNAGAHADIRAQLAGATGGATVSDQVLKAWVAGAAYQLTAITYDGTTTDVISTATVLWPDGSAGVATVDTINTMWHRVDAYHITHAASGKTVTQPLATRNANGDPTVIPALTVA